jgi:hypothetical protein
MPRRNTAAEPAATAVLEGADGDRLMTPDEVADLIRITPSQLAQWRYEGNGPTFVKIGRAVRYRRDDVMAYVRDRRRSGTSDASPRPA